MHASLPFVTECLAHTIDRFTGAMHALPQAQYSECKASCMQSQSQYGSSFYPNYNNAQEYDAQSDVASSANGNNGGMNMPGGYGPGYGQPMGYGQPQYAQGYAGAPNPFGHPSPEGWPGPGHNVQGQVRIHSFNSCFYHMHLR